MTTKGNLDDAKKRKNDEFYTMYSDVEKELQHYKQHFNGKIVYCNCDTTNSTFWKYFYNNFEVLGLKKIISTYYSPNFNAYKTEYTGGKERHEKLNWNGDFRSEECQRLLGECDIVCTNPPFSLAREYVAQLMEYERHFLIIGCLNWITYKEIFPLLKTNKVWLGYNGVKQFMQPDGTLKKFNNILWFTNLGIQKQHESITLSKEYSETDFPKYDNYDAINVDKVSEIPKDYDGVMGVPITFLDKYCPEQFEIIGLTHIRDVSPEVEALRTDTKHRHGGHINGKEKYMRILIMRRR